MKKLEFYNLETGKNQYLSEIRVLDNDYMILSDFLISNRFLHHIQTDIIEPLEEIIEGNKTFQEIQDPNAAWNFADGYCEFEVEGKTAYFTHHKGWEPNLEMPLQEVVDYLKEWKAFLEQK